jgi:hypothetical protein
MYLRVSLMGDLDQFASMPGGMVEGGVVWCLVSGCGLAIWRLREKPEIKGFLEKVCGWLGNLEALLLPFRILGSI